MTRRDAREAIFARLGAPSGRAPVPPAPENAWAAPQLDPATRIELLEKRMAAVGTQVRRVPAKQLKAALARLWDEKRPGSVAYGEGAWFAKDLAATLGKKDAPDAVPFDTDVEAFRDTLFGVGASVTSVRLGIAENGALLLTPDGGEPRLLSLVPPVHVAVLKAADVVSTFAEAIAALEPAKGMPANALLITGPSKTADIELTLAFGVHGPKELIVLILE